MKSLIIVNVPDPVEIKPHLNSAVIIAISRWIKSIVGDSDSLYFDVDLITTKFPVTNILNEWEKYEIYTKNRNKKVSEISVSSYEASGLYCVHNAVYTTGRFLRLRALLNLFKETTYEEVYWGCFHKLEYDPHNIETMVIRNWLKENMMKELKSDGISLANIPLKEAVHYSIKEGKNWDQPIVMRYDIGEIYE